MKVAVCVPSFDMVHMSFAMCLADIMRTPNIEVSMINVRSSIIATGRNILVQKAQENGVDAMLFLDSDMVFPRDTLTRLLAHGKAIVGATYVKRTAPHDILGVPLNGRDIKIDQGLVEMTAIPTGCMLVRMPVYKKLERPYFRHELLGHEIRGEDYSFCYRLREVGVGIWLDATLSREVGHIGECIYTLDHSPGAEFASSRPDPRNRNRTYQR